MKISDFDYNLPKELIANTPATPRDSSNLLVLDRKTGTTSHHRFTDLPDLLDNNHVLVFNQTKVFPARLLGNKKTGGKIELLLLNQIKSNVWEAICKGKLTKGSGVYFGREKAKILSTSHNIVTVQFKMKNISMMSFLDKFGKTPLPPYIKSDLSETQSRKKYQTVYAKDSGSAAAPTAGLHFTTSLLTRLKKQGVKLEYVTLHVGLDTFAPVKEEKLEDHQIHSENFFIDKLTIDRLNKYKRQGKKIVSVGTTVVRVLETLSNKLGQLEQLEIRNSTKLFIYPSYKFKFVDGLITNFHLPKSTLIALVSSFTSYPQTKTKFMSFNKSLIGRAYNQAINNNYRFYSFGDAMLIL